MKRITYICFFLVLLTIFIVPNTTLAQFSDLLSPVNASTIVPAPRYPEAYEEVTLTLNDYSVNTNGATIQWFIDGIEIIDAKNERSLRTQVEGIGVTTKVLALTKLANGTVLEATYTATPIRIDLLVEADTLTPPFYKGRSIPSTGSSIRVTALPFTGTPRSPQTYSYSWRVGNAIQSGGSRYGKNSIVFDSSFERDVVVSVDVLDTDGTILTSESIAIPLAEPELYFYEINPLRGISEIALHNGSVFIGNEMRLRAEPYFIDSNLLKEDPYREWKIDHASVQNNNPDPQEITLRRQGNAGSFSVEFHIRNLKQLLQGIKKSITLNL